MKEKYTNFFNNFGVIFLYALICLSIFLYRLIVVAISNVTFDWSDFLIKTIFDNVIILIIFIVGYPDGKNAAKNEESFKKEASALNEQIDLVISSGQNMSFRKHCDVWNSNEEYLAVKHILEIECGLTLDWYYKTKDEIKEFLMNKTIDRRRYYLIRRCQKHKYYSPKVNANRILTADTTSDKVSYTLNETKEMFLIIIPKIILTCLIAALFSINMSGITFLLTAEGFVQAIGSLLTSVLSIFFARRAGAAVIQKRKVMFHRWEGFIINFFKAPLTDENKLTLDKKDSQIMSVEGGQ